MWFVLQIMCLLGVINISGLILESYWFKLFYRSLRSTVIAIVFYLYVSYVYFFYDCFVKCLTDRFQMKLCVLALKF